MTKDKLTETELKECRHLWDISKSPAQMLTSLQTPESIAESWNSKMAELGKKYDFDPRLTTVNLQTGEINKTTVMERTILFEMKVDFNPDKGEMAYSIRQEAGIDRMIEMEIARLRNKPERSYEMRHWIAILGMIRGFDSV